MRRIILFFIIFCLSAHAESINKKVIIVHGYKPEAHQFDALERALKENNYEAIYFNYDWKKSLEKAADEFVAFAEKECASDCLVFAHSMGGLVSRRGMIKNRKLSLSNSYKSIKLVTVASPFGGFESANATLKIPFNVFGINESHRFVANKSAFIQNPGELGDNITHFKIETIENNKQRCRSYPCTLNENLNVESDASVLPENQINRIIDEDLRVGEILKLDFGHVNVLRGYNDVLPKELLEQILKFFN